MRIFSPLDAGMQKTVGGPIGRKTLLGLRFFWLDGIFASFSDNAVMGFLELFLLSYGASNSVIGLSASAASLLGAVSIIPGAMAMKRGYSRRSVVVASAGWISRLCLLSIAFVPLFQPGAAVAVACLIGFNSVRTAACNFANPAWTSLAADLVPMRARGRYFGFKGSASTFAAIVAAPLAGYIVKRFSGNAGHPQAGYQLIYFLAFAVGTLATLSYASIPEDGPPEGGPRPRAALRFPLRSLLGDRRFFGLVLSAFVWNVSLQIAGPFFNVYLVKNLGASAATVGTLSAVMAVFTFVGQLFMGRITDKVGDIKVQTITGLLIPFLPLAWLVITDPRQVILLNVFSGLLWAAYNLANFNTLLKLTPDEGRSDAVALYQTSVMAASVLGSLLGGVLADFLGFWAIFAASGLGRFIGTLIFIVFVVRTGPLKRKAPGEGGSAWK